MVWTSWTPANAMQAIGTISIITTTKRSSIVLGHQQKLLVVLSPLASLSSVSLVVSLLVSFFGPVLGSVTAGTVSSFSSSYNL